VRVLVVTVSMASAIGAGCGRLSFDPTERARDAAMAMSGPPVDVAPVDFGADCIVGFKMDEPAWTGAAGQVIDSCGGHNGTAVQDAARVDDPERGRTGNFPTPSGCVQIADDPALHVTTALTMSAWVYPQSLDAVNPYGVIAKRTDFTNDDAEYTMFVWTDNTVWVDLDTRDDRNHGNTAVVNNQWQQLTVVYDGELPMAQRVQIYINGELDAVIPETSSSLAPFPNPLSIGCLPQLPTDGPQIALGGRIDDAALWSRAFSSQDVAAWYQATLH
jgi:hypothetical protein